MLTSIIATPGGKTLPRELEVNPRPRVRSLSVKYWEKYLKRIVSQCHQGNLSLDEIKKGERISEKYFTGAEIRTKK